MNIVRTFREAADHEKAGQMSAYMKNKFPFLGLSRPVRNELQKEMLRQKVNLSQVDWEWIESLYELPEREFHYLAVDYLRKVGKRLQRDDLSRVEVLIRSNSWWDTVDSLAMVVGEIGIQFPEIREKELNFWIVDPDFWIRRTAILHQLKYKSKTDTEFLSLAIGQNLGSKEFFINKAIGWALREFSKTRPEWVRALLENESLSTLSRREASKYLT